MSNIKKIKSFKEQWGDGYFEGQLLIATPALTESCFSRSVIYLCQHNDEGAMGLIINQKLEKLDAKRVLEQFSIKWPKTEKPPVVRFGGPVDMARGFVLHSTDYTNHDTYLMNETLALTSSVDILNDMVAGKGPQKGLLALGYTGWSPTQLEKEIEENSWFTAPATPEIIFDENDATKWERAAESVGVNLMKFSSEAGHA